MAVVCSCTIQAQSMKMVVDKKGEVVGRYVRTSGNSFIVEVQDTYDVPKAGNRVVTSVPQRARASATATRTKWEISTCVRDRRSKRP